MSGLGNRTAILTLSRLASYGLMLISPVFLVRLLTVAQFGRYREFLLYASILQALAVFSINDSLLYCVPANPASPWRLARQTSFLTLCRRLTGRLALAILDGASGGRMVNGFLLPLTTYTLLSVNLDFWEYFWLANGRALPVFIYSATRLAVRVAVAVTTAAVTHDVGAIIWALVAFEVVRVIAAAIAMFVMDRGRDEPPLAEPWRDQIRFCVPSGIASLLAMLNRNLSNVIVAKSLGAVSLAQYAIGRFGEPVVATIRNSVSSVVLPEMVRKDRQERGNPLAVWQKATVVNAILLFPIAILVVRYAEPLVVLVFGASYRQAALIMQIYMLVVLRECFDFAPALRAINRTRPLVESNVAGLVTCAVAMLLLIPVAGTAGAMLAFVIASYVDALWLGWRTLQSYDIRLGALLPWGSIAKTGVGAVLAGVLIVSSVWTDAFGRAGIALAALAYVAAFALLLLAMRIPEAIVLQTWGKRLMFRAALRP